MYTTYIQCILLITGVVRLVKKVLATIFKTSYRASLRLIYIYIKFCLDSNRSKWLLRDSNKHHVSYLNSKPNQTTVKEINQSTIIIIIIIIIIQQYLPDLVM